MFFVWRVCMVVYVALKAALNTGKSNVVTWHSPYAIVVVSALTLVYPKAWRVIPVHGAAYSIPSGQHL